jgi:hypothetical protein
LGLSNKSALISSQGAFVFIAKSSSPDKPPGGNYNRVLTHRQTGINASVGQFAA